MSDLQFSVSADGEKFISVPAKRELHFSGAGDYDYWKPVLYRAAEIAPDSKFLKIEWRDETQVGRVEITHGLPKAATP